MDHAIRILLMFVLCVVFMGSVVRVVHLISVSAVPKYYLPASGDFCRGLSLVTRVAYYNSLF